MYRFPRRQAKLRQRERPYKWTLQLANSGKVRESGRPAAMCTGIGFRMRMSRLCGSGGGPL
jgi:hypothetical protein